MTDYFLEIEGITGESQDPGHKGEIEIESFSWGETFLPSASDTVGAGKVQLQDFHITKRTDMASPLLMLAAASGRHFTSAVLTAQRPGKEPQDYLTITLSDLMVSSYRIEARDDQPVPADEVSFSFERIEITYSPELADGTMGVSAGWDITANRKI
jgi:type VI secretion system secreted protein Hcp